MSNDAQESPGQNVPMSNSVQPINPMTSTNKIDQRKQMTYILTLITTIKKLESENAQLKVQLAEAQKKA
jgi:hypothetical protein